MISFSAHTARALLARYKPQFILALLLVLHLFLFAFMINQPVSSNCNPAAMQSETLAQRLNEANQGKARSVAGLSRVEISVRPSAFSKLDLSLVYDLYFSGPSQSGTIRSENVYDSVLIDSYDEKTSSLRLFASREDVSVLLSLERLGEFRLVVSSISETEEESERTPLTERQWVRSLLGLDSLEILQ